MTADDIPTTITRLVHAARGQRLGGPLGLSTNDAADLLAHFWPAIEAHVREQVAQEIEKSEFQRGPFSGSNHYLGGYTDALADAARIARSSPAASTTA